uniref:Ig-like domain-containing protein n=1 Tax=Methanobrevibacter sp. TaxID=66852 RepID=UPI00386F7C27
ASVKNTIVIKNVLKVKNVSKKKAKKIRYSATLKTSKGKAISGKKITFKVKGKTYKAKTNKKGIATVGLKNLKEGKYKISVSYLKLIKRAILKVKK